MSAVQVIIFILSSSAIWLVGRREKWSRYGYIAGLLAQPFWIYTSYKTQQWGIFAMSFIYIYSWSQGIYNHFIKK